MQVLSDKLKLTNSWAKFKNGMTTETWNSLKTRHNRETDEQRALAYMAWKTGERFDSVVWTVDDAGVKRVRYVFVKPVPATEWCSKKRRYVPSTPEPVVYVEIPHWDFAPEVIEDSVELQGAFA